MKKSLFFAVVLFLLTIVHFTSQAQDHAPAFTGGAIQSLSLCENASSTSLNLLLAVIDSDAGQTETWSSVSGPMHGTASVVFSTTSTDSILTPSGLSYTPATGFSGMDTLMVQVTDGTDTGTTTIYITVTANPYASAIGGPATVCVGASAILSDSTAGGSWSITNSSASVTGSGLLAGLMAGRDTVYYFVTNTCGTSRAMKVMTVNPLPYVAGITGHAGLCVGATDTLTDSTTGGTWSASNGSATLAGAVLTGVHSGIDTITYVDTNSCGTAHAELVVTISPTPAAGTITGGTSVCAGATLALTDSLTGGSWSASNGTASVTGGVVTGASAGVDTISYSITNSCGTSMATHIVTINARAAAGAITGAPSVCVGASTIFSDSISGGTWSAANSHASLSDSFATGLSAGPDTISYSVTNGCGTTTTSFVLNVLAIPVAGPITGPTGVCAGRNITLSAPATGGSWIASNSFATLSADTVSGASRGLDTIYYRLSNACGADTARFVVSVDTSAPSAGAISGLPVLCVGDSIRLTETASGGYWTLSTTALATVNHDGRGHALAAGTDTVFYTVSNGCGTVVANYGITINPSPDAGVIDGYDSVCGGSTITLTDGVSGGHWVSLTSVFASVDASGIVRGLVHGTATIIYVVSNSCGSDTARHPVNINIPAQPIVTVPDTICQASTTSITPIPLAGTPSGGTWTSNNPLVVLILPIMGSIAEGITIGTTEVIYTVNNACGRTSDSIEVSVINCTGLSVPATTTDEEGLVIAPNPNSGSFELKAPTSAIGTTKVSITNMLGEKAEEFLMEKQTDIKLNLAPGMYFVTAENGGKKWVKKMIISQ